MKHELDRLLRILLDAVARLDEEDYGKILDGRAEPRIVLSEANRATPKEQTSTSSRAGGGDAASEGTPSISKAKSESNAEQGMAPRVESGRQETKQNATNPDAKDFECIVTQLRDCESREAAYEILRAAPQLSTKDDLTQLAKFLKVYVAKSDRRADIEDKIVGFTVGARLRTEAIHGLNFKKTGTSDGP